MKRQNEMILVKEKDAKELASSITEVEASKELYEIAVKQANYSPQALREVLEQYMNSLKKHKEIWRKLLHKYVEEKELLFYRDAYRYDIYKKVIFLPEIEEDKLCNA